jgi:hypothetical protein
MARVGLANLYNTVNKINTSIKITCMKTATLSAYVQYLAVFAMAMGDNQVCTVRRCSRHDNRRCSNLTDIYRETTALPVVNLHSKAHVRE